MEFASTALIRTGSGYGMRQRTAKFGAAKLVGRNPALAAKGLMRRIRRMEAGDCRGFLQNRGLVLEVQPAKFGDSNWKTAKPHSRPQEASSWLHLWRDAGVSSPGMCGPGPSLPWRTMRPKAWNNASPRSRSASILQAKPPQRTNACDVDLRNGLRMTSQVRFRAPRVCTI